MTITLTLRDLYAILLIVALLGGTIANPWHTLTPNEQAVLACMVTCVAGLFIGAAWVWWRIRTPQTVLDDLGIQEYEDAQATIPPSGGSLYAGPVGLIRLKAKVAESNNGPSADYYLDKMLAHPDYRRQP